MYRPDKKNITLCALAASAFYLSTASASAAEPVLKGSVKLNGAGQRLARPQSGAATTDDTIPVAPSRLSGRANSSGGLVDPNLFAAVPVRDSAPLQGNTFANQAANSKFDIGAERGSRTPDPCLGSLAQTTQCRNLRPLARTCHDSWSSHDESNSDKRPPYLC